MWYGIIVESDALSRPGYQPTITKQGSMSRNCVNLSTNKGGKKYFWTVLLGHVPNKAFLVPDSCGATERNGNSIRSDATDDTIEND